MIIEKFKGMCSGTLWAKSTILSFWKYSSLSNENFFGCTYRFWRIWLFSRTLASFSDRVWASSQTNMSISDNEAVKIFFSDCWEGFSNWIWALRWWALRYRSFSESKRVSSVWFFVIEEWCVGFAPYLGVNLHDDNIRPCMWLKVSVRFIFSLRCLFFLLNMLLVSIFQMHFIRCPMRMLIYIGGMSWYSLLILFLRKVNFSQLFVFVDILKSV